MAQLEMKRNKEHCNSLEEYIADCFVISDIDPGLLFCWIDEAIAAFMVAAGVIPAAGPLPPVWVSLASMSQFKNSIINHLALVGGGNFGNVLCAPNDISQYTAVINELRDIQYNAWFQAVAASVAPGAGSILASCAIITDRTNVRGIPAAFAALSAPLTTLFS
jgi:hypothetical protein